MTGSTREAISVQLSNGAEAAQTRKQAASVQGLHPPGALLFSADTLLAELGGAIALALMLEVDAAVNTDDAHFVSPQYVTGSMCEAIQPTCLMTPRQRRQGIHRRPR
jgi:hypothetical protein